jgi:hypothetical protein
VFASKHIAKMEEPVFESSVISSWEVKNTRPPLTTGVPCPVLGSLTRQRTASFLETLKKPGESPVPTKFPFGPAAWGHPSAKTRLTGKKNNNNRLTPYEHKPNVAKKQPTNLIGRQTGQKKTSLFNWTGRVNQ